MSKSRLYPKPRALIRIASLIAPGLFIALGVLALPLLRGALARLAALLRYPYPHDGLEGTLLYEARLLAAGQPLYQPLQPDRFVSAPYPPLHPLVLGWADQFAGPHVFWGGRLVSLIAALGVALLIVLIVRQVAGAWSAGLLGATLFLSAPPVLLWATRIKPDMQALLLTALGLSLTARAIAEPLAATASERSERRSPSIRRLPSAIYAWPVGAALCFALAFFTKQTQVAGALACGLALLAADLRDARARRGESPSIAPESRWLLNRRLPVRPPTLAFGITYLALTLGGWLLLDAVTAGQFTAHVWGLHRSEWWSAYLLGKFVALLAPYWPAGLLVAALLLRAGYDVVAPMRPGILAFWPPRGASAAALVPGWYALVAPISLLGAGETGANHNHLLEALLALALASGVATGWALASGARQLPIAAALFALFALQLALAAQPQRWYVGELAPADPPERYLIFIRNTPGEILADDVGLLVAAGRAPRYDDPSTMGPAAASGVWDQRGLIEDIARKRFSAIMIPVNVQREPVDHAGRWSPEVIDAIREHYRPAFRDTIYTYVPR